MVGRTRWLGDTKAMTSVISHRLNRNDAISHFRLTLETAGTGAQEQFLRVSDSGDFFALAPKGQTEDRLRQFQAGGLFPLGKLYKQGEYTIREVTYHADALAPLVKRHAKKLRRPIVLLHEPYLTERDNTEIVRELTKIDSALYKVVLPDEVATADLARDIGRFTVSWHTLVILTEREESLQIEGIMRDAMLVAVGAYKGESYIYWLRRSDVKP